MSTDHGLFGPDVLQLLGRVKEVVCIRLWNKLALIRFLDKIFIPLPLSKGDSILLRLEVQVGSLHAIGG